MSSITTRPKATDEASNLTAGAFAYDEGGTLRAASEIGPFGTEAEAQAAFASKFAGVAREASASGDGGHRTSVPVVFGTPITVDLAASDSFAFGDLLAVAGDSGSPGRLVDNRAVKTTDPTRAIAFVVEAASNTTRVRAIPARIAG